MLIQSGRNAGAVILGPRLAADWTSANPTLAPGVHGYETDTGKEKIGDGSTAWTALKYTPGASQVPPLRLNDAGDPYVARTQGETYNGPGWLNFIHDGPNANYVLHISGGPNMNPGAALVGLGVDYQGYGLTVPNKKSGEGIRQRQYSTIDAANAYGYHGMQGSSLAPLMYLEQLGNAGEVMAPALRLNNQQVAPGAGQMLAQFMTNNSQQVGVIWADTGILQWDKPIKGRMTNPITTKTANYTALLTDYTILADATSAPITIALPSAASASGMVFNCKKIDASGNTVTVDPNGAELIDGAATKVISTQWVNLQFQSNGTAWFVIG